MSLGACGFAPRRRETKTTLFVSRADLVTGGPMVGYQKESPRFRAGFEEN
jgi:hypothetical protein